MRRSWKCYLVACGLWVVSGCGDAPTPVAPKEAVGPTTDPAGAAFSKPTKPAASPVGK